MASHFFLLKNLTLICSLSHLGHVYTRVNKNRIHIDPDYIELTWDEIYSD